MIQIDPNQLDSKENYKLLSGCVIPRPIAFVTSEHEDGVVNAAPFSFFNMLGSNPLLIAISVGRVDGEITKHTAKNILSQKEFVVHIVDVDMLEQMNQTAAPYKEHISEVEKANLTTIPSTHVSVPGIKECKVRLECELFEHMPLGENGEYNNDLILGKVIQYHIDESVYQENYKIDAENLNPLARLAGPNYAILSEPLFLERPTDTE
ncbi:flavin reductase (DIM6/NTAB) family NADH-FMN oxidoreductase RutF [Alkalibacillus filiformis]|uniref:Flavin reductase (DIM6/NTAB) family NADH-FMN oxidoreductase RutF n=1 Tax=Alkalibacillus filiformis TaxID=200990 RepID=A0ABU0DY03_9BACI|nr:flavin reductase family protein [Alkalibacillus filiformis]MDQ0352990.1 flavin reductase (DIM6/NTAB) family NADH-FMN oxidoreductase RutF [Alkalibacillus filiformis]